MKNESKKKILQLVKDHLKKIRLGDIAINVVNGEIKKEDAWWYVTVEPATQPQSMHQYYEVLSNIEDDLEAKYKVQVFLVPSIPDYSD